MPPRSARRFDPDRPPLPGTETVPEARYRQIVEVLPGVDLTEIEQEWLRWMCRVGDQFMVDTAVGLFRKIRGDGGR